MIFLFAPRADVFHCVSLQSEPVKGGAHTLQARACFQKQCVRENRKRPWDWPAMHFLKCLRPGAATRYWYAIRHTAERLTPLQAQSSLDCIPRFASIQGAQTTQGGLQQSRQKTVVAGRISVRCDISGWETDGSTLYRPKTLGPACRGLEENLCQANLPV